MDYGSRDPSDADLRWYRNIPVPTSYMAMGSREDWFGGYDHAAQAGFVHWADHAISPGKKLWTWGNAPFGRAWDRELSDGEHDPYIELMAGVFTDNQPDFSYLAPGETRVFSQWWYPTQRIGPAHRASLEAAVHLSLDGTRARVGVAVTRPRDALRVTLARGDRTILDQTAAAAPDRPVLLEGVVVPRGTRPTELLLRVTDGGRALLEHRPIEPPEGGPPDPAREPALPTDVPDVETLVLIGRHLDLYRHATRRPEDYWREALRRSPDDSRANVEMGLWHLRRGQPAEAVGHLRRATAALTRLDDHPADGTAAYALGLALRELGDAVAADDALAAAAWLDGWRAPGRPSCAPSSPHVPATTRAPSPCSMGSSPMRPAMPGRGSSGRACCASSAGPRMPSSRSSTRSRRTRWTRGRSRSAAACSRAVSRPIACHGPARPTRSATRRSPLTSPTTMPAPACTQTPSRCCPMCYLMLQPRWHRSSPTPASVARRRGGRRAGAGLAGARTPPAHRALLPGPSRGDGRAASAIAADPADPHAPYLLGLLLYDRRRYAEAIALWRTAARLDPAFPTVHRNLGLAAFNVEHRPARALAAYRRAFRLDPEGRPRALRARSAAQAAGTRADGTAGGPAPSPPHGRHPRRPDRGARDAVQRDRPACRGARGHRRTSLPSMGGGRGPGLRAMGRRQPGARPRGARGRGLDGGARASRRRTIAAREPGRGYRHPLAPEYELHWLSARAHRLAGDERAARLWLETACASVTDPADGLVPADAWRARALRELGDPAAADQVLRGMLWTARARRARRARVNYFATSLPAFLLFADDLALRERIGSRHLEGLALQGLGRARAARAAFREVAALDPNHLEARLRLSELG
ncbi:MAG: DUF5107 domain-containing protein [Chloroflexota bacterium]